MPLDPIIAAADAAALALMARTQVNSPQEQRDLALRIDEEIIAPLVAPPPPVSVRQESVDVPGRDAVVVHVFSPEETPAVGGYLFFFGGAFRQGGLHFPSVDALLRARCAKARTIIVAPEYALAPEQPYPIAIEQASAVLRWMVDNADALGFASDAITVGGMSAGGDIAAVLALTNRDGARLPIRQQLLEVPVSDLTGGHLTLEVAPELGFDAHGVVPMMREMAQNYLAGADPTEPTISPLFAEDLSGLPAAHILTAELDVFRGDGEAYALALQQHGTSAALRRFRDMTHGSLAFTKDVESAREWERAVVDILTS